VETSDTDRVDIPPKPDPPPNVVMRTGLKVPPPATVRREDLFPPVPAPKT